MYKLLVMDFDNTLVGHDLKISGINKKAISDAIEKGVKVCICSGRSFVTLEIFERELGLFGRNDFGICYNGAKIHNIDTREIIYEKELANDIAMQVITEIKKLGVDPMVYHNDKINIEMRKDSSLKRYSGKGTVEVVMLNDFREIKEDITKILVVGEREVVAGVKKEIEPLFNKRCNIFYSAEQLLEVTNHGASKGNALKYLANLYDIGMSEVIAIGDNHNDISMIEYAGVGCAVKNSVDELKDIAGYITESTCTENAVAEVIQKYILS